MTPEAWTAVIAGATFMVFWTATVLGFAAWISKQINNLRETLLSDLNRKHDENFNRYNALSTLVTQHDTILFPPKSNGHHRGHRD